MNLQRMLDAAVQAKRAEQMSTSEQYTPGELIGQLEVLPDKHRPVLFDDERYHPVGLVNWHSPINRQVSHCLLRPC